MLAPTLIAAMKQIRRYFGFLYQRGFRVASTTTTSWLFGSWWVMLESELCKVQIRSHRDEINVALHPAVSDEAKGIALESMIYYLSHGEMFIGYFLEKGKLVSVKRQFKELAGLLNAYLDEAIPYFGPEYPKYRDALISAQNEHNDRLLREYLGVLR